MTYYGGEKCVPGYNVMGICKAALDASMRYLAFDLGPRGVRVNALSAGPLKTLAGSAPRWARCCRCTKRWPPWAATSRTKKSAGPGAFLLSDMSDGITAEILHLDAGYNAMGSPGRMLDKIKAAQAVK
jgi:enoyl-[acyl-carrier protein] reductase I